MLELSGAVLGGSVAAGATAAEQERTDSEIRGWVMQVDRPQIDERPGVVKEFLQQGINLCNDGRVFRCRTCDGVEFDLLVTHGGPMPSAGGAYQFEATGEESMCGNFQIRLREPTECEGDAVYDEIPEETDETADESEEELTAGAGDASTDPASDPGAGSETGGSDGSSRPTTEARRQSTTRAVETEPTTEAQPRSTTRATEPEPETEAQRQSTTRATETEDTRVPQPDTPTNPIELPTDRDTETTDESAESE